MVYNDEGSHGFQQTHLFPPGGAIASKISPPRSAVDFSFPELVAEAVYRDERFNGLQASSNSGTLETPLSSPEVEPVVDTSLNVPQLLLKSSVNATPFNSVSCDVRTVVTRPLLTESQRRKEKLKLHRQQKRAQQKMAMPHGSSTVLPKWVDRHIRPAAACHVDFDAEQLKHTCLAWTGGNDKFSHNRIFTLQELVGQGSIFNFTLQRWDGRSPRTVADHDDLVFAVLAGHPNDPSWDHVKCDAAAALESSRAKLKPPSRQEAEKQKRRGDFPQQAAGQSMGGGQQVPGTLKSTSDVVQNFLLKHPAFIRLAGFASTAFAMWAPNLYEFYHGQLGKFYSHYPDMQRNFCNSVFACCTFNFGPVTCCLDHTDPGNLPFGWCAITALGNFDAKLGGHLVLWDLHLVLEFPAGSTILLPSASLRHGNAAIQQGETRYSFTQYTAGGIFRWVEQGFRKTTEWRKTLSEEELLREGERGAERWKMGVGLFSKLESLQGHPNVDHESTQ